MAIVCRNGTCVVVPNDVDLNEGFEEVDWRGLSERKDAFESTRHQSSPEAYEAALNEFHKLLESEYDQLCSNLITVDGDEVEHVVNEAQDGNPQSCVIVYFGGPGCMGCHPVGHALSELADRTGRKIYRARGVSTWMNEAFAEMPIEIWQKANCWDEDALARALKSWPQPNLNFTPFVVLFRNGRIVDAYPMKGERSPAAFETWIANQVGPWWTHLEQEGIQ